MDRAELMLKRVEKNLEMGRKMWKRAEKKETSRYNVETGRNNEEMGRKK